jgi:hypothetical protein
MPVEGYVRLFTGITVAAEASLPGEGARNCRRVSLRCKLDQRKIRDFMTPTTSLAPR